VNGTLLIWHCAGPYSLKHSLSQHNYILDKTYLRCIATIPTSKRNFVVHQIKPKENPTTKK
jgi:hypothetical protein